MKKNISFGGIMLSCLKSACYFVLWYAITMVVAILAIVIFTVAKPGEAYEVIYEKYMAEAGMITALANGITILALGIIYKIRGKGLFEKVELRKIKISTGWYSLLLGACMQFAVLLVIVLLGAVIPESWIEAQNEYTQGIVQDTVFSQIVYAVIMAPLLEEILFRGLILNTLRRNMNDWVAIIISALAFGLVHGTPIGIIYATVVGILMGWLFVRTNSLLSPILFHFAFNLMSLVMGEELNLLVAIIALLSTGYLIKKIADNERG